MAGILRNFQLVFKNVFLKIKMTCMFGWWRCVNKKLFIRSITFAKMHLPDSAKWMLSSNRWILEILLLSTNIKLLFLYMKEITSCDIHSMAAFLIFSIRFSSVSDLLCTFCRRSLTPKWRTGEPYFPYSRVGFT